MHPSNKKEKKSESRSRSVTFESSDPRNATAWCHTVSWWIHRRALSRWTSSKWRTRTYLRRSRYCRHHRCLRRYLRRTNWRRDFMTRSLSRSQRISTISELKTAWTSFWTTMSRKTPRTSWSPRRSWEPAAPAEDSLRRHEEVPLEVAAWTQYRSGIRTSRSRRRKMMI